MNHWRKPVDKGPAPIVPVLLILFLVMFFLGLCQEYEAVDEPQAFEGPTYFEQTHKTQE